MKVKYAGPFTDASGYGEATRNFIRALHEAGADITTEKISFTGNATFPGKNAELAVSLENRKIDYKYKIIHTTPDIYHLHKEKGKYNIGHLFWETDRLPDDWVAACNTMDEIWTGTKLNKEVFEKSGVTVPIVIIPQAIETFLPDYRPFRLPNFPEDSLLFYSIFDWNDRKDPKTLLDAFWKAFKGHKDVGLLIKTYDNPKVFADIRKWKSFFPWKDKPRVFVSTTNLSEDDKHRLHATGDVFVSAHRGEGWGLPQAEALIHKKAVISTNHGGIHEYLTGKQFFPVDFQEVTIKETYKRYYQKGMKWAQVDEAHLIKRMKQVYDYWNSKNRFILKTRGGSGHNRMEKLSEYENVGKMMIARMVELNG